MLEKQDNINIFHGDLFVPCLICFCFIMSKCQGLLKVGIELVFVCDFKDY